MSTPKNPTEVTATTADFSLKKKLGDDVDIREVFTEDAIASADSVIEESKKDFFNDAESRLSELEIAHKEIARSGDKKAVKVIERGAHSLKGQSETLGFDLLAHVSKSLYEFCAKHFRAGEPDHVVVLRKHLDTLQLIVREKMQSDGGPLGKELISSLHKLCAKYS